MSNTGEKGPSVREHTFAKAREGRRELLSGSVFIVVAVRKPESALEELAYHLRTV